MATIGQSVSAQALSGENAETGWRSHWDTGIIVVLALAWLAILFAFAFRLQLFSDELDIILPATNYINGHLHVNENVKYPSFSFYFYGFFFRLFRTAGSTDACLPVARVVNYSIFVTNIFFLHAFLRRHFPRLWALVGTVLFTTLPGIVFSAIYVKTEGLLLFQLLFVLLVLGKLSNYPHALRWHALAAIGAALSIATKLSPLPFILCAANAIYLRSQGTKIAPRAWVTFCGAFLVTILAAWRNLWFFDKVLAFWKKDLYFFPGAGPFNAVTEGVFSGFPYGRFGSFITVTMPVALGLVGLFFLGSLFARSIPRWLLWVFGGGNLISLLIGLSTTRLRLPHGFTPHIVFFLVAGVSFLAWLGSRRPADHSIFNSRLAWILVAASLSQTAWQTLELPGFISGMSRTAQTARSRAGGRHADFFLFMYPNLLTKNLAKVGLTPDKMKDFESLREAVALAKPKRLYIFSSYIDNMCKYATQPTYRDNCDFFYKELLPGKTAYRIEREEVIPWKGYLLFDPEFSRMRFFLFSRSTGSE